MTPTHVLTLNGRTSFELKDDARPIRHEIRHRLEMLNAQQRFSVILWKIPEGVAFPRVDPDEVGEYMQCGGSAERMTVEMRTLDNGTPHQHVIGRADSETPEGDAQEEVSFGGGHGVRVYASEVFDTEEAADLLFSYFETGDVPDRYTKRLIQL